MGKIFKGINIFLSIILFIIALGIAFVAIPYFGNQALIVRSGSMEPTIGIGSIVVVRKSQALISPIGNQIPAYTKGDVIAFRSEDNPNTIITHRVYSVNTKTDGITYRTKGDANKSPDGWIVNENNILGKSYFVLPGVGQILTFAKTRLGFASLIIFPALLVILIELVNIISHIKKNKKEKENTWGDFNYIDNTQKGFRLTGLKVVVAIAILVGVSIPVAFAFFSDSETSLHNIFQAAENFGQTQRCSTCDGDVVTVDQNVTIDFNQADPNNYYSGDPDLKPYFSFVKNATQSADNWKAIFDLKGKKLLVKSGATITVVQVGAGNNKLAPGIEIDTTCSVEVENGGHIIVESLNQNAGNISINTGDNIIINGEVRNEVTGTNGLPGKITMESSCGDYAQGTTGFVNVEGIDPGGNDINIFTHKGGDIDISGVVMSRAHAHVVPLTLHRPNINVVAYDGKIAINGNTPEPIFDNLSYNGGLFDIWGGLLSWVRDNVNPGSVHVQASGDITVKGHGNDPTPPTPVRESFGAIAAISTGSDAPGGVVDVRSIGGKISGDNRSFDVSGRNRLATNFAHITLFAKGDIVTSRTGATADFNPVVDASSPTVGDKGGTNELRSFSGGVFIDINSLISAHVPPGSGTVQGVNLLQTCTGITNNGTVDPADLILGDNTGSCATPAPTPLF